MEIECLLDNKLEKGNKIVSNIVQQFIETLQESIKTNELKESLQSKYNEILKNDENLEYSVFSKVAGKDYTILSFQNEGDNIIKIPNVLLPKETNSRTVFNFQNGEFKINQERTEINNKNWKKEQETEEILKENRIYFVDNHRNDYTEVIAVDNGKTYQFDFMQPYIGRRLKIDVNEGEYIIAKDGKFEKYEGNIKINNERTKEKIKSKEQEIKNEKLNREENLREGKEFIVKERINSWNFIVQSIENQKETYMGLYTNTNELEELQIEGTEDIYCYESNNATRDNLNEGDKLVTKNGKIIKEGTENLIEDNKIKQYTGKSGEIYIVDKIEENSIKITNINSNKDLMVKKEDSIDIREGDFIKTKNIGYARYDGAVQIKNQKIKENMETLYNHII